MTQEDKELLLKVLCAILPYGVRIHHKRYDVDATKYYLSSISREIDRKIILNFDEKEGCGSVSGIEFMDLEKDKPYLRPMSSMTEEEKKEYESFFSIGEYSCGGSLYGKEYEYIADSPDDISQSICLFDWLNAQHFDYHGLIEKGLALEAPKDMYQ